MTFFIVQARLPTAETTHLAKSFVELFVKYQVRNVYILSAPNFKAQASNAVHVIHLPDLDLDDKNGG